jgi:hypothetical protein
LGYETPSELVSPTETSSITCVMQCQSPALHLI